MFIKHNVSVSEGIQLLRDTYGKKIRYMTACAQNPSFSKERQKLALDVATFMKMKLQHTMFVQKEGMNILQMLKTNAHKNPTAAALNDLSLDDYTNQEAYFLAQKYFKTYNLALLWHDLGRTQEFDDNCLPTRVDHALSSREMLESRKTDAMLVLIVRNHGYSTNKNMYEYCEKEPAFQTFSKEEKRACKLLSLMVRDADKLGNWKTFAKQGVTREVVKRIKLEIYRDKVSIGSYEMSCVLQNVPIDYSQYSNFSGIQLAHLMWSADMALVSTKEAAIKGNFVEEMLDYMREVAQDDTALKVAQNDLSAVPDYQLFLKQQHNIFEMFQKRGRIEKSKKFDSQKEFEALQKRLKMKNFAVPRVQTTGLVRYNTITLPPRDGSRQ